MMLRLVPENCKGKMACPRKKIPGRVEGEIQLLAERNGKLTAGDWAGQKPDAPAKDRGILRSRVRLVFLRSAVRPMDHTSQIRKPWASDSSGSRTGMNSWATYPWKPVSAIAFMMAG